jgi:uncharacterized membrane protein YcaP (DUF421 family)
MNNIEIIFGQTGHVTWWQECARTILIFVYGLLLVRIAGRRVFGKWSALDIIVSIVAGSNLSRALTGSAALGGTLVATTLLMLLHWVLAQAAARWPRMAALLEGSAIELARGGNLADQALRRHAVSEGDLNEALRQAGIEHVSDARLVVLEPSGKIAVLKAR